MTGRAVTTGHGLSQGWWVSKVNLVTHIALVLLKVKGTFLLGRASIVVGPIYLVPVRVSDSIQS